jgi:hypothetical protein
MSRDSVILTFKYVQNRNPEWKIAGFRLQAAIARIRCIRFRTQLSAEHVRKRRLPDSVFFGQVGHSEVRSSL